MSGGGCCGSAGPENSGRSACCPSNQEHRKVELDFLYLDLSVCTRCSGTDANLDAAIEDVRGVLTAAGFDMVVNKVNIASKELAIKYQFVSSPTIRVNGRDIQPDARESLCESCSDLCGGNVDCRVWTYGGRDYTVAPREMIVNTILREVYSGAQAPARQGASEYRLPRNLEKFFATRES